MSSLKITTLSTMLADRGIGEWGYAALIEVDDKKILFDTGQKPQTVLANANELGIDLADVEDVFLSHNHFDHTGGILTLRRALKKINPNALSRIHVGKGIFIPRDKFYNMDQIKKELEADGVQFFIYEDPNELFPGVWITGPVKRIHPEKNWYPGNKIMIDGTEVEDNIPEDQSLAIETPNGFVLVSGCGHAGIVNTLESIKSNIKDKKITTVIGGFHLVSATDQHLAWTAEKLKDFGVVNVIGSHCTGINSLYTLRNLLDLDRKHAVVGSVGDSYDLEKGIKAGYIAR
ncbi:MBL fold metallo-hydrolase [Ekhidna sp.]|uniref:MBL fold metallo-hydrolase n=1 Tax=Ekhidna sp. TaxID=2608089 RepID=UPI003CCB8AD9